MEIVSVKIKDLDLGENARKEFKDIDRLKASIDAMGLLEPPGVKRKADGTGFCVVYGFSRLQALRELYGEDYEGDFIVVDSDAADLSNLGENIVRTDLRYSEIAVALCRMKNGGKSTAAICKAVGYSKQMVHKLMRLKTNLLPEIWEKWTQNEDSFAVSNMIKISALQQEKQTLAWQHLVEHGNLDFDEKQVKEKKERKEAITNPFMKGKGYKLVSECREKVQSNQLISPEAKRAFILALDIATGVADKELISMLTIPIDTDELFENQ